MGSQHAMSNGAIQVTALAAVQKLEGKGNIMGISMGSSEGAGYANAEGSWVELGFAAGFLWISQVFSPVHDAPNVIWELGMNAGNSKKPCKSLQCIRFGSSSGGEGLLLTHWE